MKFFSILTLLAVLGSTQLFAWSATLGGPANPVKREKYDYKISYMVDETNKNKELEKVEYHWVSSARL